MRAISTAKYNGTKKGTSIMRSFFNQSKQSNLFRKRALPQPFQNEESPQQQ